MPEGLGASSRTLRADKLLTLTVPVDGHHSEVRQSPGATYADTLPFNRVHLNPSVANGRHSELAIQKGPA